MCCKCFDDAGWVCVPVDCSRRQLMWLGGGNDER